MTATDKEKPRFGEPWSINQSLQRRDWEPQRPSSSITIGRRDIHGLTCDEAARIVECVNACAGIDAPAQALRVAREALTRVAKLNESAGEIGAGMLAIIVGEARAALTILTQSQPEGRKG